MKTKFIEAQNLVGGKPFNWGKFAVCSFEPHEWARGSKLVEPDSWAGRSLLMARGWGPEHLLVLDIETGEGAVLPARPTGSPTADLNKHAIWVCPLFEPFLAWLYQQNLTDLDRLPDTVTLEAEPALAGYRRPGPGVGASKR